LPSGSCPSSSLGDVELDDLLQSAVGGLQFIDAVVVHIRQHHVAFRLNWARSTKFCKSSCKILEVQVGVRTISRGFPLHPCE
jgi:hypothetical protein